VLIRRTQDPEYWRHFGITSEDLEFVYELIIESNRPISARDAAHAVVRRRLHQEETRVKRLLEHGRVYRPAEEYEEGDEVLLPQFEFAQGVVVGKREGYWPGHPDFHVIAVQIGDEVREFASGYTEEHKLNEQVIVEEEGQFEDPETVFDTFGEVITQALEEALEANSEMGFVELDHMWFLRGLLPEVHVGHLNLAEAVIEVTWEQAAESGTAQRALTAEEILRMIDVEGVASGELAEFALDLAMSADERFVDVGVGGQHLWLLKRLVPREALETPARLRYDPIPFSMEAVPTELFDLIWAIPDEHSLVAMVDDDGREGSGFLELVLTYPHRRAGTLPLVPAVARLLQSSRAGVGVVTLLDEINGETITGWVSQEGRYVFGLGDWYERHGIPAGAYITLSNTAENGVFNLGYRAKRRTSREYVRLVTVKGDRLSFEIERRPLAVEFDETMIMIDEDPEATDRLWAKVSESKRPVPQLIREVFPELAKLSPQGTVHVNTLYTAVNVLRRTPPEPILAELTLDWRYVAVGSGYYAADVQVES